MNVAELLENQAKMLPDKTAIVFRGERTSFKQLDETINRFANYFSGSGISRGEKVLLFIRPSVELLAVTFALFKMGAIPVFIDPGMGVKNLLKAVEETKPQSLIAVHKAYFLSVIFHKRFKSVKTKRVCTLLMEKSKNESSSFEMISAREDEMAAILFTSGGTGPPRGAVYTHKIFITQTRLLQEMFSLTPDDIDVPCFSLFSFFTIAMGMTSYIPTMDPSNPSETKPDKLVQEMLECNATFAAGSPAIWMDAADYCLNNSITLPALKHLVMFGAPVQMAMHEKWRKILPNGTTYTPYGATECLPISNISGEYILESLSKDSDLTLGTCVGKAVNGVGVGIIDEDEIIVSGDVVTREYYDDEAATQKAKRFLDGELWHRTGDVGTVDENGDIWFWGRKAHVIETQGKRMYPVPCENVFNRHDNIRRCALVGPFINGRVVPSLVIERNDGKTKVTESFLRELEDIRDKHEHTRQIERFFLKNSFPVDGRHNIKIDRIQLRKWAEKQI